MFNKEHKVSKNYKYFSSLLQKYVERSQCLNNNAKFQRQMIIKILHLQIFVDAWEGMM
jgi:hypothetical protein